MTKDLLINNWRNCLTEIQKDISASEFEKWIRPIKADSFDGATLLLAVPSKECAEYIDKNILSLIKQALKKEFSGIKSLRYILEPITSAQVAEMARKVPTFNTQHSTQAIHNPFVVPGQKKIIIDPQLNFDYNFESFIGGSCNHLARVTGMAIAKNPGAAAFNPFFVHGDSGLGKTHLVQAIGIEIKKNSPDMNVLYVSMNQFLDQYTTAARKKEVNNFVKFYQLVDVLIIDDIHELSSKPGTQSVLFSIFNHLQLTGKQLIFTCDKAPSELKDIENRLITRFKWGITVNVEKPDFATKVKIIESKSVNLHLRIPTDVIEFIAKNVIGSVREIEGVISSFVAYSSFLKKEPTLTLAKEIMKSYITTAPSEVPKEVAIDNIQIAVCDHCKITKSEFYSKKRTHEIAFARQVAMYLCKEMTTMSLKAIGSAIGGKTHATVLHAHKTIINRLETNKEFKSELESIREVLASV